ncbi:uncharacterized protein LOC130640760 isoform X1 [Hydractinia symbiolongicarpus]|uniref:uncharacterized protein LOC130640760 isoform X1 n=1 Tax=Hydractinia symbiolongicarpus TaxID=13093 RepID=UPI00254A4D8E|nr:uncharacterized protein LOC130640760 isoform X1 [Hydractinia symbiolongicarpus]
MDTRRPKTVKVTVYSSRNLKQKKGDGDPLAWVVFGFGKEKCCTSQIRDRNAKWNEESTFTITDQKIPLKINIKDKDDPLGQIIIPVNEIPSEEHFLKWVPLGPHKKNSNPSGELCIDCWVEDYYDDASLLAPPSLGSKSTKPMKYFNKTLNRLTGKSPESIRRLKEDESRRHSYASGVTSIRGSVSVEDLSHRSKTNLKLSSVEKDKSSLLAPSSYVNSNVRRATSTLVLNSNSAAEPRRNSFTEMNVLGQLPTIKEQNYPPKVLNIIPKSGPVTGGTLIQITGKNLGASPEDITRLMVAGCNCLSSLEYYTSSKIMCTTSESEGVGPISISTRSGGMSSSKVMFEFVEEQKNENGEDVEQNGVVDSGRSSGASDADRDKDEVIEHLRMENDHLRYDNRELREYIDKLVVYLMDKYPDALESSKMYR